MTLSELAIKNLRGYSSWAGQPPVLEEAATELERLTALCAEQSMEVERLRAAGAPMANVMFNFGQRIGHVMSADECAMMRRLQLAWDLARTPPTAPTEGK